MSLTRPGALRQQPQDAVLEALAELLTGLDVDYGKGRRVGDARFPDGSTLFQRLRTGRHVGTDAGLVRPDGHPA